MLALTVSSLRARVRCVQVVRWALDAHADVALTSVEPMRRDKRGDDDSTSPADLSALLDARRFTARACRGILANALLGNVRTDLHRDDDGATAAATRGGGGLCFKARPVLWCCCVVFVPDQRGRGRGCCHRCSGHDVGGFVSTTRHVLTAYIRGQGAVVFRPYPDHRVRHIIHPRTRPAVESVCVCLCACVRACVRAARQRWYSPLIDETDGGVGLQRLVALLVYFDAAREMGDSEARAWWSVWAWRRSGRSPPSSARWNRVEPAICPMGDPEVRCEPTDDYAHEECLPSQTSAQRCAFGVPPSGEGCLRHST